MQEPVARRVDLEERVLQILGNDPDALWNVTRLTSEVGEPRRQVENAIVGLEARGLIGVERVGNSLIIRRKPSRGK